MNRPTRLEEYLQRTVTKYFSVLGFSSKQGIVEVVYQDDRLMLAPLYGWELPETVQVDVQIEAVYSVYDQMRQMHKSWFRLMRTRRAVVPLASHELFYLMHDGLVGTVANVQYLPLRPAEKWTPD